MKTNHFISLAALLLVWAPACARQSTPPGAARGEAPLASSGAVPSSIPAAPVTVLPHPVYASLVASGQTSIADIAERVTPSVVSVISTKIEHAPQGMAGSPLWQFFGPLPGMPPGGGGPGGPGPYSGERKAQGLGSGVVVAAGVIVTNNHVVEDADQIKVTAADGKEYDVQIIGTDPKSDLAVLRVKGDSSGLRPLPMGDSTRLRPGEIVLAIGNPFGVGQTVTMGIVSAKGRADLGITDYEDFIQTDAAINPGNSGGALVSMGGELIGINTAILSRSGGYQGIGFAIPTEMARPIVESLLTSGRVERGWLGVAIQTVDQDLASALNLPSAQGVLVSDVGPGTPAARAGLQRGDVILDVDGKPVDSTGRLRNLIAASGSSAQVKLKVIRNRQTLTIPVALGEMPDKSARSGDKENSPVAPSTLNGLGLESLTPQNRQRFRVAPEIKEGAVITAIEPGSPGSRAGLRPGDVVVEINRQKVTSPESFRQHWTASGSKALLLISRQGHTLFMVVNRN